MVQNPHGKQKQICCLHLSEPGVHEALSWIVLNTNYYCQQSQALSLTYCGPLEEKLAM